MPILTWEEVYDSLVCDERTGTKTELTKALEIPLDNCEAQHTYTYHGSAVIVHLYWEYMCINEREKRASMLSIECVQKLTHLLFDDHFQAIVYYSIPTSSSMVSSPDPTLCEGKSLVTLEHYLGCADSAVMWPHACNIIRHFQKFLCQTTSTFDDKAS